MNHKFCRGKLLSLLERQCLKKLFKMVCLNKTTFFLFIFFTKVHRIFIQFWLVRSHNISTHFIAWSAFIHHHQPKRIDSAKNIKKQKKTRTYLQGQKEKGLCPKITGYRGQSGKPTEHWIRTGIVTGKKKKKVVTANATASETGQIAK